MRLEGGELTVGCVIICALIEYVVEHRGEFDALVEFIDQLGVEQEHVFICSLGEFVAVMLAHYAPFPFGVRHNVDEQGVLHTTEP